MTLHPFWVIPSKNVKSESNHEETSNTPRLRDFLQNIWLVCFEAFKEEGRQRLRSSVAIYYCVTVLPQSSWWKATQVNDPWAPANQDSRFSRSSAQQSPRGLQSRYQQDTWNPLKLILMKTQFPAHSHCWQNSVPGACGIEGFSLFLSAG